jgi:hypothetical protein
MTRSNSEVAAWEPFFLPQVKDDWMSPFFSTSKELARTASEVAP